MNSLDDILTLAEASDLLKVCSKTVVRYWKIGQLPGQKLGRQYRFLRSDLLLWSRNVGNH